MVRDTREMSQRSARSRMGDEERDKHPEQTKLNSPTDPRIEERNVQRVEVRCQKGAQKMMYKTSVHVQNFRIPPLDRNEDCLQVICNAMERSLRESSTEGGLRG